MRENNKNLREETDAAFALTALLLNVLNLFVLGGGGWLLYSLFSQSNSFGRLLSESVWR
ncbi:MAG: hypothetical protein H0X15_01680 [Acidobacteria bacterium]|jgi:hypothetical protein|nr:hypothetical protein [Acidobacteriota bacterium]MBA4182406.1 hypothetical protein [Acidobacteriota bacterium]